MKQEWHSDGRSHPISQMCRGCATADHEEVAGLESWSWSFVTLQWLAGSWDAGGVATPWNHSVMTVERRSDLPQPGSGEKLGRCDIVSGIISISASQETAVACCAFLCPAGRFIDLAFVHNFFLTQRAYNTVTLFVWVVHARHVYCQYSNSFSNVLSLRAMFAHCSGPIWQSDDLSPCFETAYVVFPLHHVMVPQQQLCLTVVSWPAQPSMAL